MAIWDWLKRRFWAYHILMGDAAHARRAANHLSAARDAAVRYSPNLRQAGLSGEAMQWLDGAMDELRSPVAQVEDRVADAEQSRRGGRWFADCATRRGQG